MLTHSETLGALAKAKAMAQAKFLPIGKGKSATVTSTRTGTSYTYDYADLAACLEAVIPALSEVGIALFQPVRVEDGVVIATTLLVHESGEWIADEYSVIAVDPRDPRSVGSAATYARRYGLLAMLGIATHDEDEDDDAEKARGGKHEMARTPVERPARAGNPVCPVCGKDAVIKGKLEYGGGWLCFGKKGGCGAKWPDGPFPTAPPAGDVLSLVPGTVPAEQANAEGDALFPTEAPESPAELLESIRQRFKLVKSEIVQQKLWREHVGAAPFLTTANVDVAALNSLLAALGGSVAR